MQHHMCTQTHHTDRHTPKQAALSLQILTLHTYLHKLHTYLHTYRQARSQDLPKPLLLVLLEVEL